MKHFIEYAILSLLFISLITSMIYIIGLNNTIILWGSIILVLGIIVLAVILITSDD